jgi:hypothetical protein
VARATEWRRFIDEYDDSAAAINWHKYQLPSLSEGETFTRLRMTWQAQHVAPGPGDAAGMVVVLGVIVVPAGTGSGGLFGPATSIDQDFVWWESGIFQSMLVSDTMGVTQELDVYPVGDCLRDVKAMRKADIGGSEVWLQTENTSLAPSQTTHYLTVSGSMLVTLPA